MTSPTQLCGDYFINHEVRIPAFNNQDDSCLGFISGGGYTNPYNGNGMVIGVI